MLSAAFGAFPTFVLLGEPQRPVRREPLRPLRLCDGRCRSSCASARFGNLEQRTALSQRRGGAEACLRPNSECFHRLFFWGNRNGPSVVSLCAPCDSAMAVAVPRVPQRASGTSNSEQLCRRGAETQRRACGRVWSVSIVCFLGEPQRPVRREPLRPLRLCDGRCRFSCASARFGNLEQRTALSQRRGDAEACLRPRLERFQRLFFWGNRNGPSVVSLCAPCDSAMAVAVPRVPQRASGTSNSEQLCRRGAETQRRACGRVWSVSNVCSFGGTATARPS